MPTKIIYLLLAAICVAIGIVGLIIPIIPGLLFLLVAVYLLGKVSGRFKRWSDQQPMIQKVQAKLDRLGDVNWTRRIKVVGLMGLEMMVSAVGQLYRIARGVKRRLE